MTTNPIRYQSSIEPQRSTTVVPFGSSRRQVRAERRALQETTLHDLEMAVRERRSEREVRANFAINSAAAEVEFAFYDEVVENAGTSAGKQRIGARRVAGLQAANDRVIDRYCL